MRLTCVSGLSGEDGVAGGFLESLIDLIRNNGHSLATPCSTWGRPGQEFLCAARPSLIRSYSSLANTHIRLFFTLEEHHDSPRSDSLSRTL